MLDQSDSPARLLHTRLLSLPQKHRSSLSDSIQEALATSNTSVTEHMLEQTDGDAAPPTVTNWLNDFQDHWAAA